MADSARSAIKLGMGASSMASGRKPSKLIMMARLIFAREGNGVAVGVNVGLGVNVAVVVGVMVGVRVAAEVGVIVGVSVGKPVGVGTGGRELPQILGSVPQPAIRKARRRRVRRFRRFLQ